MSLCAQFLSAARKVAKAEGGWTDRGCAVLEGGGWYFVEDSHGVMAWEGDAHCRYCARAEAICYLGDPTHMAKYQQKRDAMIARKAVSA